MATFSPSPAPRSRLRTAANSPPVASKRIRVGSSRPTSRFATPIRGVDRMSFMNDNASVTPGMDVDETNSVITERGAKAETVFAKSEELVVSFYAHLPAEVKQSLKNADFYGVPYTGDVDTMTGFSLVASVQTCFVWQHAQAVKGTPTCYIFSCPRDQDQTSPPFHALVPYGSSREPGLILISLSGEIRFWHNIGIGLAGGEHYTTTSLGLSEGDSMTNLIRSDPKTYIATSSAGNLFRLTLTSSGGKHHLNSNAFSRPKSTLSLSRLIPSFWSSSSTPLVPEQGNISAVTLGVETPFGKDVWALVDSRLQKWNMSSDGWEEVVLDEELVGIIRPAVRKAFPSASVDNMTLDLELLDLAIESSGKLVILISYAGAEDAMLDIGGIRRIYALVRLSYALETLKVESVSSVPYQSTSTSGAPMHPRIKLVMDGSIVSIQFGDVVALCAGDSHYQDRLELKSATDRTLGVGVVEGESVLFVLTAATMVKAYLDMEKVASFGLETGRANLIKSIMTQAILYGSYPENPLHFSFPPDVDEESLMQGAEQLSQAILESDNSVVRRNHDLGAQLTGRKERLSWLIRFINDNAALTKMSQRSRQHLATDAEKLYACHQLWLRYNDVLATGHTHSVLNEAVLTYMNGIGEGHHEDVMRAFFRHKVANIGLLLLQVMEVMTKASREPDHSLISETNNIILTVLKSALNYREYNLGVYGIVLPMISPWTSKPAVIDIVLELFNSTTRSIEFLASESGKDHELFAQLPELASILFACIQERLDWLGSAIGDDQAGAEVDRKELDDRFAQLRPEVLDTIRRNGHADHAFELAESYRDFRTLASLCHKDDVFPPQNNPNALRIQNYIEKFKQDFATELYQWYIEHGELRVMFALEDAHTIYMDKFFAENPNPLVSWIHDLGMNRHSPASDALFTEAESATDLKTKHLMLSIGKLAHLAQLHETEASVDETILDAFHDDLDFVSVHETLVEEFKSALSSVRGKQTISTQVDIISKSEASKLAHRKALLHLFKQLVRQLLQGKALQIEDAVDVLTLKDNYSTIEDYATALHLLARVKNLPNARRTSAFQTVWRRIYLHDDWDNIRRTANITDTELSERFQQTALYATLLDILPKQHQPEGYDLLPAQSLPVPSTAEISSRWPGMSPDQVEAIAQDYQSESEQLADLALDDVYHRIRELVGREVMWGAS